MLASNDPVALDTIAAELIGLDRGDLLFPLAAYYDGVGEIERNRIQVIGPDIRNIAINVEKPIPILHNRFPCNVALGGMCDGCFAWFMAACLFWERDGVWEKIHESGGKPTFMFGFNAKDLKFEKHIQEGPYFVVGDCTPEEYRNDPRTVYIKGCCPGPAIAETTLEHLKIEME